MDQQHAPIDPATRRGFLVRVIQGIHAMMGATLAFVVGGAVVAPSFTRRTSTWLHAGELPALDAAAAVPVTLRVARPDGATDVIDRRIVYVVRTGEREVHVLDSTCTHLGCRTRFNPESRLIECPCHGGVYDTAGQVVSGPPPSPLRRLPAKVEDGAVFVEI